MIPIIYVIYFGVNKSSAHNYYVKKTKFVKIEANKESPVPVTGVSVKHLCNICLSITSLYWTFQYNVSIYNRCIGITGM